MTVFDKIREAVGIAKAHEAVDEYARALAVGVGADDPDPGKAGIVALCYQRKLFSLAISPGFADPAQISLQNTEVLINGCIQMAFATWEEEFMRLRGHALSVIRSMGDIEGAAQLREEIAENELD